MASCKEEGSSFNEEFFVIKTELRVCFGSLFGKAV